MKAGLSIPGPFITDENLAFARQVGVTHVVAHIVGGRPGEPLEKLLQRPAYISHPDDPRYSPEGLADLRQRIEAVGMELFSIENFEPADWYDVLLDGPLRDNQMEKVKQVVRDVGAAGIPTMGYNFSIAAVWGRPHVPVARGGAMSAAFGLVEDTPIPKGMVWNSIYDEELYARSVRDGDYLDPITSDQLWDRFSRFLREMLPIAEEAGVRMALHPDDPPVPVLRGTPRLVYRADLYDRVLGIGDSASNGLEFCVGTLSEMPDQDIYEVVEKYVATGRIRYVHLRNVTGRAPRYEEKFIDEGYVDLQRVLGILRDGGFDGVVIPDHSPFTSGGSPWHGGTAYALGWIRGSLKALGALDE